MISSPRNIKNLWQRFDKTDYIWADSWEGMLESASRICLHSLLPAVLRLDEVVGGGKFDVTFVKEIEIGILALGELSNYYYSLLGFVQRRHFAH
jgi:hypothetical protein